MEYLSINYRTVFSHSKRFARALIYSSNEDYLSEEQKRYHLHKKIHQAFWSLTNLYLTEAQLQKHPEQSIDKTIKSPTKSWGDYQKVYADCNEELTAQYFYELSLLNFQLAQEEQAF